MEFIMANEITTKSNTGMAVFTPELEQDFDTTTTNLENLITIGTDALDSALETLKATEATPRTVESFATLLKAVSDINGKYLDVKKSKAQMQAGINPDKPNLFAEAKSITANQYVFNGSTADLYNIVADITAKPI